MKPELRNVVDLGGGKCRYYKGAVVRNSVELMTKYWYRIRLSRSVKAQRVADVKDELIRLFQSTDVRTAGGRSFDLTTALEPVEAGAALDQFCAKHGSATFVAGSQKP